MVYEGYVAFGGNEIVNSERTRGYAETFDCPIDWFRGDRCEGLVQAVGDADYVAENIPLAPWYDISMPEISGRFLGVHGLELSGLQTSTRSAGTTEGIDDGGVVGRTRKGVREVRARAVLTAKGRDALDYGISWLSSALDPGACGQHGSECGTTDMEFFTDCPPERGVVNYFSDWETEATNLLTNPSMETGVAPIEVRRNLAFGVPGAILGTRVSDVSYDGDLWYQFTATGQPGGMRHSVSGTTPGATYTFSAEVANPGSTPVTLSRISWSDTDLHSVTLAPGERRFITSTGASATLSFADVRADNGQVFLIRLSTVEAGPASSAVPFDGAQRPAIRRNLALDPRVGGATGWKSNNGALYPITRGVTPPVPHPLGIPTSLECRTTGTTGTLATLYDLDSRGNAGTPERMAGMWVLVTEPGYRMSNVAWITGEELPVNEWVWVRQHTPTAAGQYQTAGITTLEGAASTTVRAYVTGALVQAGSTPVGDYFDGVLSSRSGFGGAWVGAANNSASYEYDVDLTPSWTGSANASPSILSGVLVADMSPTSSAQSIRGYQTSQTPALGQRAARFSMLLTTAVAIPVGIFSPVAGTTYTMILRVRANDRDAMVRPRIGGSTDGTTITIPQGQWVEIRHTTVASSAGALSTGLFVSANPARLIGDTIDVDAAVLIEGTYLDGYFDGSSSPESELVQYAWTGAANASTSIMQTREALQRPQTDEEYAATLAPYRRFLHDVAATSGPLPINIFESNVTPGIWGAVMEWTITSERPWIYSTTRPVNLPVTPTTVIQDVPFNLVPYPSAELPGPAMVAATNYSLNPSLEANATGWAVGSTAETGSSPAGFITSGRVTGELQAVGASSFRARLLGNGTTASGRSRMNGQQVVDLAARPAGSRVSFTVWAAMLTLGGAPVTNLISMQGWVRWMRANGTAISSTSLGLVTDPALFGGTVFSAKSLAPPSDATQCLVYVDGTFEWASGATNSDVRLYVDALAVTVP